MSRFQPKNTQELAHLLLSLVKERGWEGDFNDIDVSRVFDFSELFSNERYGLGLFNGDISKWDVSEAACMALMFKGSSFNRDIGQWDVSNLQQAFGMFKDSAFDQPLKGWNVRRLVNAKEMFKNSAMSQSLVDWNLESLMIGQSMFEGSQVKELPIPPRLKIKFDAGLFLEENLTYRVLDDVRDYMSFYRNTPFEDQIKPYWPDVSVRDNEIKHMSAFLAAWAKWVDVDVKRQALEEGLSQPLGVSSQKMRL